MTDKPTHPIPDFSAGDFEARFYVGAHGQLEEIELERFYWIHLDWYEEQRMLDAPDIEALVAEIDADRGVNTLADCLRVLVDRHLIPAAISSGIPPFDEIDVEERERMLSVPEGDPS